MSDFIATHIIKQLLELGYRVRGTVRSLKNEEKVAPLRKLVNYPKHELELVEADLLDEGSWYNAVQGCTHVLHTASSFPNESPKDENELIVPAVNGTLNVFNACVQQGSRVKRVVLTSSIAAIAHNYVIEGKFTMKLIGLSCINYLLIIRAKCWLKKLLGILSMIDKILFRNVSSFRLLIQVTLW